jgi:hypothetical protein
MPVARLNPKAAFKQYEKADISANANVDMRFKSQKFWADIDHKVMCKVSSVWVFFLGIASFFSDYPASSQSVVGLTERTVDAREDRAAKIERLSSLKTRRERPRKNREDTRVAADAANHVFRSILGESVHEPRAARQRRVPRPPEILNRHPEGQDSSDTRNSGISPHGLDPNTLTTKQAARDHVEKTLGHHRRRRRRRQRNSNSKTKSEL